MTFEDALRLMKLKKARVKRKIWSAAYLFTDGDSIFLGREGSSRTYLIKAIDAECIMSNDWQVIECISSVCKGE